MVKLAIDKRFLYDAISVRLTIVERTDYTKYTFSIESGDEEYWFEGVIDYDRFSIRPIYMATADELILVLSAFRMYKDVIIDDFKTAVEENLRELQKLRRLQEKYQRN